MISALSIPWRQIEVTRGFVCPSWRRAAIGRFFEIVIAIGVVGHAAAVCQEG
jgi:hypothetical protein